MNYDKEKWLAALTAIIKENLGNPFLTNAQLAEQMGSSKRLFYVRAKEILGITPNLYARQIRLEAAKKLLETHQNLTIKDVALKVGYLKSSYFSEQFEKQFGYRASEIKNQKKK